MSEFSVTLPREIAGEVAKTRATGRVRGEYVHVIATIALTLASVPLLKLNHLPVRFAWGQLLETYWMTFAFQGTFAAILLYIIGFSPRETVGPIFARLTADKRRIAMLIPFLLILYTLCVVLASAYVFPFLAVFAFAVLEWFDRTQGKGVLSSSPVITALLPAAAYLFWGLVLVSAYNDIAVASKPNITFDVAFNRADSWLLNGATVSAIAHTALHALPVWSYKVFEFVYYFCMFPQIGAAMLLLAFRCGRGETFRFAATLLTAYYLAIVVFWIWPTQGPFLLCARHFRDFPSGLITSQLQRMLSDRVASIWSGHSIAAVGLDYYIAFPSLHIAIPMITAIYLRRWRRVFHVLLGIDALIVSTVILLEWHYVLDVIGGLVLAALVTVLMPPQMNAPEASVRTVTNSLASAR